MEAPDHIINSQTMFKAWIVFSGQADLACLRVLKEGYRHCSLLMHDGQSWISFDPMLHHTDICTHHHVPVDFDLPAWFAGRGHTVIKAPVLRNVHKPAPLGLLTCVESIKRILGYHNIFVLTPWQLYKYVCKLTRQTQDFQISDSNKPDSSKGELSWEV